MSSCLIAQVGLGLLDSSNPPASASCGAEITGTNHRTSLNSTQSSPPPTLVHGARIPVEQDSSPAVSSLTYFLVMSWPEKKKRIHLLLEPWSHPAPFFFLHKMQEVSPDFTLEMLPPFVLCTFSPEPLTTVLLALLTFLLQKQTSKRSHWSQQEGNCYQDSSNTVQHSCSWCRNPGNYSAITFLNNKIKCNDTEQKLTLQN